MTLPGPMLFVMDSSSSSSSPGNTQRPASKIGPRMTRYRYGVLDLPPPPPPPPPSMPLPEPPRAPSRAHFPHVPPPPSTAPPTLPPPTDPLPALPLVRPHADRRAHRSPRPSLDTEAEGRASPAPASLPKDMRRRSRSLGAVESMQQTDLPAHSDARRHPVRANTDTVAPLSRSVNDVARTPTPISRSQSPMPTLNEHDSEHGEHPQGAAGKKSLRTVRRMSRSLSHLRELHHADSGQHVLDITPFPQPSLHHRDHFRRPSTADADNSMGSHDGGASRSLLASSKNQSPEKGKGHDVAAETDPPSKLHSAIAEPLLRKPASHSRRTTLFRVDENLRLHDSDIKAKAPPHPAELSVAGAELAARDDSAVRQRVLPPPLRRVSRSFTDLRVLATRDSLQAADQAQRLLLERIEGRPRLHVMLPAVTSSPDYTQMMSQPRKAPSPPAPQTHPQQSKFVSALAHLIHSKPAPVPSSSPKVRPHKLPPPPAPVGEQPVPASRNKGSTGARILSVAAISRMKAMSPATMMSTFAPLSRPASRDSVTTSESQSSSNHSQSSHAAKSSIASSVGSGTNVSPRALPSSATSRVVPQNRSRTSSRTREVTASPVDPVTTHISNGNRISFLAPAMVKPYMGQRF